MSSNRNRRDVFKVPHDARRRVVARSGAMAPSAARAQGADPGLSPALGQVDQALRQAVNAGTVPGVVAIGATDNGIVYEGAFGPSITADSVFWIASMTKAITATAAMQLVEQGKLQLDQPMGKLLPQLESPKVLDGFDADGQPKLRPAKREITLRHLLTHTAGFTYSIWSEPMTQYEKVTRHSGYRRVQERHVHCAARIRSGRALAIRHQHGLGRQGGGSRQRSVAGNLFPREHFCAAWA